MLRGKALGARDRALLRRAGRLLGLDEVGRGCLAGPVVVVGVVFDSIPTCGLVRDSKTLSPAQRTRTARWITANCATYLVVEVWPELIDRLNILEAVRLAMRSVITTLATPSTVAVVDHVTIGDAPCPVRSEPRADADYFCVAAASILAKVHRDQLMVALDRRQPLWAWARNKGYATEEHRRALQKDGPSYLHRRTFTWTPVLP
jgi:ribonuclease HII